MIPKVDMVTIQIAENSTEIINKIIDSGHSRYPVLGNERNEVEGILLAKDILPKLFKESLDFNLNEMLRDPNVVPETKKADSLLVSQASNFKVGTDYYSGSTAYWGASHRLLDTAYVVAEYSISEGETTIPSLDFVVRGKGVECYNYDFSFEQDPDYTSSDAATSAFNLGDTVALTATSGGASLGNATIADIYTLTNVEGTTETRIRFLSEPPLNYNSTTGFPAVTAFVMTKDSNSYHLVTHNHTVVSGTVAKRLEETVTSVANNSSTGVDLTMSGADSVMQQAMDFAEILSLYGGQISTADQRYVASLLNQYRFISNSSSNQVQGVGQTTTDSSTLVKKKVEKFWAYPSFDERCPPPHSTGGALDITLADAYGNIIDMGSDIDQMDDKSKPDFYKNIKSDEAIIWNDRRNLLKEIMVKYEFVQHPNEWWHFSYGDQLWAWKNKKPNALYGKI